MTERNSFSPPPAFHVSVVRLQCSACGAEANASCSCGKPYVPAKQRAKEAIEANPQKSDRAIADEIGVGKDTVRRARDATGACAPVDEPRVGRDGRTRKLPSYIPDSAPDPDAPDPAAQADIVDQIKQLFKQLNRQWQIRCGVELDKIVNG